MVEHYNRLPGLPFLDLHHRNSQQFVLLNDAVLRKRENILRKIKIRLAFFKYLAILLRLGLVAQSVEQRIENPCVGGSIPPRATKYIKG